MSNERALALYIAHRHKLVDYAQGIMRDSERAEDVVQEAYFRLRTAASERLIEEPVAYLYRIVRNLSYDRLRRISLEDRHMVGGLDEILSGVPEDKPSPEDDAIVREELRRVAAAIAELPDRARIALEMHRFDGCTLRQIADHLGISISMAQVLLQQAIRHCQRRL